MAHVGKTEQLTLRAKREIIETLKNISRDQFGGTFNQLALLLVEEGLSLLQNPDQCPPLSPEFMRLREKLHGKRGGTYADEPGRVPAGPTVAGNMQANDSALKLLESQERHIARLEAEISRLKGSPPGFQESHHEQSGGGAMAV